jgi:chromate reductase, NAD(P)H dehydrogenase (quinone)
MAGYKVGYFIGGLVTKSINRLLAKALVRVAPQQLQLRGRIGSHTCAPPANVR